MTNSKWNKLKHWLEYEINNWKGDSIFTHGMMIVIEKMRQIESKEYSNEFEITEAEFYEHQ